MDILLLAVTPLNTAFLVIIVDVGGCGGGGSIVGALVLDII